MMFIRAFSESVKAVFRKMSSTNCDGTQDCTFSISNTKKSKRNQKQKNSSRVQKQKQPKSHSPKLNQKSSLISVLNGNGAPLQPSPRSSSPTLLTFINASRSTSDTLDSSANKDHFDEILQQLSHTLYLDRSQPASEDASPYAFAGLLDQHSLTPSPGVLSGSTPDKHTSETSSSIGNSKTHKRRWSWPTILRRLSLTRASEDSTTSNGHNDRHRSPAPAASPSRHHGHPKSSKRTLARAFKRLTWPRTKASQEKRRPDSPAQGPMTERRAGKQRAAVEPVRDELTQEMAALAAAHQRELEGALERQRRHEAWWRQERPRRIRERADFLSRQIVWGEYDVAPPRGEGPSGGEGHLFHQERELARIGAMMAFIDASR